VKHIGARFVSRAFVRTIRRQHDHRRRSPTGLKESMQRRRSDVQSTLRDADTAPRTMHIRFPTWPEQLVQYLTRYLFATLGLLFFNYSTEQAPLWLSLRELNAVFGSYLVVNTLNLLHAFRRPHSAPRYRFALLLDVAMVSVGVINDPNIIPPSMAAYIVVVLGNGMRYGIRFFAEALVCALLGAAAALTLRYWQLQMPVSQGTLFLTLFGAIIVVYAYILMGRIERSRQRSELRSRTDSLTGLLNRDGLADAVASWVADKRWSMRQPVVVFADLDNFKTVNDTFGHAEGDRVLAQVARLLKQSLRANDLIARYGGDEFVVLLADVDTADAESIVARMQATIESWFRDSRFRCGISIGFAPASAADWDLEQVLKSVDRLLYQSKALRNSRDASTAV
jgi:diguanylate cyclase (GGDEF)-like protein